MNIIKFYHDRSYDWHDIDHKPTLTMHRLQSWSFIELFHQAKYLVQYTQDISGQDERRFSKWLPDDHDI